MVIGAGAGLSASAGFVYTGERLEKYFSDFAAKYGIQDMYSGGFYPFATPEEHWAYWSRYIYINRYMDAPKPVYDDLLKLVQDKDYFVITTNVDHCFQKAGFDKKRLFYTQGDYGLFQCSKPCCQETFENEAVILEMVKRQEDMKIPTELLPVCLHCGKPMTMNLRSDNKFIEDEGWHRAAERYKNFLRTCEGGKILFLEVGRWLQHPRHHQVSLLADDNEEYRRYLRLYQPRSGSLPAGTQSAGNLYQCRYWTGFAEPVRCCNSIKGSSSTTCVSCDRAASFYVALASEELSRFFSKK